MITNAALALGLILAIAGYKQGFYSMWAIFFNVLVSIYLGVMLSPTLAPYFGFFGRGLEDPSQLDFWYTYAICVAAVAFGSFCVLQVFALTYLTGTFNVNLPKIVDKLGSLVIGFATGYIIWLFVCFVMLILPKSDSILTKAFTGDSQARLVSEPVIRRVVKTVGAFSLQSDSKGIDRVIKLTLPPLPEPEETK